MSSKMSAGKLPLQYVWVASQTTKVETSILSLSFSFSFFFFLFTADVSLLQAQIHKRAHNSCLPSPWLYCVVDDLPLWSAASTPTSDRNKKRKNNAQTICDLVGSTYNYPRLDTERFGQARWCSLPPIALFSSYLPRERVRLWFVSQMETMDLLKVMVGMMIVVVVVVNRNPHI